MATVPSWGSMDEPTRASLRTLAATFQTARIIPHCPTCARPCCGLTDVVLDLSRAEADTLYRIGRRSSKRQPLPSTLREEAGRFYAHGAPCPAYVDQRCSIYGTPNKPSGCTDFPLYLDGDLLTADRRCEALEEHLTELRTRVDEVLGAELVELADPDFENVFVYFGVDEDHR